MFFIKNTLDSLTLIIVCTSFSLKNVRYFLLSWHTSLRFFREVRSWLIGLSKPLELEYLNEVYELEESKKMAYISNAEKLGIEKGIKKRNLEIAEQLLGKGFKPALIKETTGLSIAKIKALQQKLKREKH